MKQPPHSLSMYLIFFAALNERSMRGCFTLPIKSKVYHGSKDGKPLMGMKLLLIYGT